MAVFCVSFSTGRTISHELGVMQCFLPGQATTNTKVETIALADVSKPLTSLHTVRNLWLREASLTVSCGKSQASCAKHDYNSLIEFGHAWAMRCQGLKVIFTKVLPLRLYGRELQSLETG